MSSPTETSQTDPAKKNYLSLVAIFKNEAHGIREWIEHYINEGVDHFYLIDNGSSDNYQKEIQEFLNQKLITLVIDDTKWAQVELYNKYFLQSKDQSEWFMICDLDEFIYARNGYTTIAGFLKSLSTKTGVVRIPWKMFGSSGLVDQPQSIVGSFLLREAFEKTSIANLLRPKKTHSKAIVRSQFIKSFHIHFCYLQGKLKIVGPDKKHLPYPRRADKRSFQPLSKKIMENSFLHLNHYALQSKNWFLKVKCTRGSADNQAHETHRDVAYFESYNKKSNEVLDNELAKKWR